MTKLPRVTGAEAWPSLEIPMTSPQSLTPSALLPPPKLSPFGSVGKTCSFPLRQVNEPAVMSPA